MFSTSFTFLNEAISEYSILDHINDYSETNILLIRNSKIISSDAILLSVFLKKVVSSSYG